MSLEQEALQAAQQLKRLQGKGTTDELNELIAFGDKVEAFIKEQPKYLATMQTIMKDMAVIISSHRPTTDTYEENPLKAPLQELLEQYKDQISAVSIWMQQLHSTLVKLQVVGQQFYKTHPKDPLLTELDKVMSPCFHYLGLLLEKLNGEMGTIHAVVMKVGVDLTNLQNFHEKRLEQIQPPDLQFIEPTQGRDMVLDQFNRGEITKEQLANRLQEFAARHPNVIRTITNVNKLNYH